MVRMMNERIAKLYDQALVLESNGDYVAGELDPVKFAELIVRECAQAFEAEVDTWKQMDPYQGSIKRQGAKAIKQHFGVK